MKHILFFLSLITLSIVGCAADEVVPTSAALSTSRSDGAAALNIPVTGSLQNPAWSPSSGDLLFTRFVNGYNTEPADLLIFNTHDHLVRSLVADGNSNVSLPGAAWNRLTDHIVFSSERESHDEIYTIYAFGETDDEWQVTDRTDQMAYEPSLSPDGGWIVFESHPLDVETDGVITTYKIDGSEPYRSLTPVGDDCRQPNWSPTGDLILYQKVANGRWDLWTMAPDGSDQHQITTGAGDKTDAAFSPDGKWIIYSSDEGSLEYANLYIIPATGGTPARLTTYSGYDGAPSWSPDGRWAAFESSPQDPDDAGQTTLWQIRIPEQFAPALLFDGGFETGDASEWYAVSWNQDRPLDEQMQIVTDPVRQGQYAAKLTVHDGDQFMDTSGERVQFDRPGPDEHDGDEYWYAWSTFFPDDWQPPDDWLLILDWHATYANVCQPLQLEVNHDNSITIQMLAGDVTGYDCYSGSGTALNQSKIIVEQLTLGEWNDFVIHVKWTTGDDGLIEIWHKLESDDAFAKVLTWNQMPTLQYKGDPANLNIPYLLLAHYRSAEDTHISVLYHDGFRMAESAAALVEDGLYDIHPEHVFLPLVTEEMRE